jgi:hypothetical protein
MMHGLTNLNLIVLSLFTVTKHILHFAHPDVTFSLLGPNILLGILSSNTLGLCSSFTETDQISHSQNNIKHVKV